MDLYLGALHDEFVDLLTSIKPSQLAYSAPGVEEPEENKDESQPSEGCIEVDKRQEVILTRTVRQSSPFFPTLELSVVSCASD